MSNTNKITDQQRGIASEQRGLDSTKKQPEKSKRELPRKKKSVLFAFDGTGNDVSNVNPEWNVPTHVVYLYESYKGFKKYYDGVGTRDYISHGARLLGNTSGLGARERIDLAIHELETNYNNTLDNLNIDVIGFSRGAAMARYFTNLIARKYPVTTIRFLGIFDTVAQFGTPDFGKWSRVVINNYGYQQNIPRNVKDVFHAVAKNENRGLFPLTSVCTYYSRDYNILNPYLIKSNTGIKEIRGAGNNGKTRFWEKPFSGAHSDVGGGYADGTNTRALYWMLNMGIQSQVPFDKSKIGRQVGVMPKHFKKVHDSKKKIEGTLDNTKYPRSRRVFPGNLNYFRILN